MHRADIARATGAAHVLTADHDGVLVADVAAEWAARHAQPYTLHLTGPAGGTWASGEGGPLIETDAVEFCRVLSGRGHGDGLLAIKVPFLPEPSFCSTTPLPSASSTPSDHLERLFPRVGESFVDQRYEPIMEIVLDMSPGPHDMLFPHAIRRYTIAKGSPGMPIARTLGWRRSPGRVTA